MYIIYVIENSMESAFGPFNSTEEAYKFKTEKLNGKVSVILFLRSPH
jgi:hypothetical protein